MGSQAIQGKLWGQRPDDCSDIYTNQWTCSLHNKFRVDISENNNKSLSRKI